MALETLNIDKIPKMYYIYLVLGVWFNGRIAVSKTVCVGSIPTTPAISYKMSDTIQTFLLYKKVLLIFRKINN